RAHRSSACGPRPAAEGEPEALSTILIVEDNPDMRAYLRGMLSGKYRVLEAADGEEALEALKDPDIDFVISDIMMPRMDGLTFVGKMKENFETSHIPVLMLTAKTAQASQLESFRLGVDGYITKPFSEEMLLARIDAIMANRMRRTNRILSSIGSAAASAQGEPEACEDTPDTRFIKQVMETIEANYKNSYYEVGDFAEDLGVSRTVLNKKLQSLLGKSANKLIRDYRLNIALQLIKDNRKGHGLNISEIAYEVGFNDSKYFTRCFTKRYGVPPNAVMQGADPEIQEG
ncbi:MAG: response regulator, partial [Clostridium sp.]|nr:response regulator [Clostridium sp.]